jgi:hypothetical protein
VKLSVDQAAAAGVRHLERVTRLPVAVVAAAEPVESGWHLQVELVEKQSIPRGMDVLGLYDAWLDAEGNLQRFSRRSTRRRMDALEQQP